MRFDWVTKMLIRIDAISVLAPNSFAFQNPGFFQLSNNPLNRAFGNSDMNGDFTQHHRGILRKQNQHM